MATESVIDTDAVGVRPAQSNTSGRPFWALNGSYEIGAETRALDAENDALCLLESIEATVRTLVDGLEGDDGKGGGLADQPSQVAQVLYGVKYQIQMVRNLVGHR